MKESISVFYKNISTTGNIFYHKYIVYTDSNGNKFYARGGPKENIGDSYSYGGSLKTIHGEYKEGTID